MSEPFLGEIRMFGGNFAPRGWAMCNGQILAISTNTALFALLGTTYGGNGQTTFALPDLRGRVPIHMGQGPGLSPYSEGQQGGVENVTLTTTQMPVHTHTAHPNSRSGNVSDPQDSVPAQTPIENPIYRATADPAAFLDAGFIGTAGGSQPHQNIQPYLVINFIIALQGIFPSRN